MREADRFYRERRVAQRLGEDQLQAVEPRRQVVAQSDVDQVPAAGSAVSLSLRSSASNAARAWSTAS